MRILTPVLVLGALAGCAPQTDVSGKKAVLVANAETLGEAGGEVTIDGGVGVAVRPGTVAVGTEVTVEAVAAPDEFATAGVLPASGAVAILATGPDGLPVDAVTTPMVVNLIIDESVALALADPTVDNICVLLKTRGAELFVWRRALVAIDEARGAVQIATTRFGTFQLAYCGQEALAGFTDAGVAGITGEAKAALTMKVKAGYMAERGHARLCGLTARSLETEGEGDGGAIVLAAAEAATGADAALELGVPKSQILRDGKTYTYYAVLMLMGAGSPCPAAVGEDIGARGRALGDVRTALIFRVAPDALAAGTTAGTVGETGPFAVTTTKVALGAPAAAGFDGAAFAEAKVCLGSELDGQGMTRVAVDFGLNGAQATIGGAAIFELPVATGTGASGAKSLTVSAAVGQGCTHFDAVAPAPATGKPYEIWAAAGSGTTPAYLTPVTLQLNNSALTGNGCLRVYKAGMLTQSSKDRNEVGRMTIALTGAEYRVYLPYMAAYDMQVQTVGTGDCDAPGAIGAPQTVPLPNRPLAPVIQVSLDP